MNDIRLTLSQDDDGCYIIYKVAIEDGDIVETRLLHSGIYTAKEAKSLLEAESNKENLDIFNADINICIKERTQNFIDAGVEYDEVYIDEQIWEQRPGRLTARENINGIPGGIYHKFDIYPTKEAKKQALKHQSLRTKRVIG